MEEIHRPHDAMVRAVLSDLTEARSFLQVHLPEMVSQALTWPTLKILEGSFIDEDLRSSEADLLYEVEHVSGEQSIWLYVLLEHQSTSDRWMRLRLLKYCCRIWEMNLKERPRPNELRPIVPLVFYQGNQYWTYSTEFADLFAESIRNWPWVPHFHHELLDQSGMQPDEVQGDLKVQLMQLLMLAAYHPAVPWMERVAELWSALSLHVPSGGINYVRLFVLYILATQEPEAAQSFSEVLRRRAPVAGDDLMTYAQQLLAEGREAGRIEERVKMIEGFLQEGIEWSVVERASGINEAQFQALKQQLNDMAK